MRVVIKVSGKVLNPKEYFFSQAVLQIVSQGVKLVIVHGGGPQITSMMEKLGRKPQFVNGLRVTTSEDMEITEMVLSGLLNKMLVGMLLREGIPACGVSGKDGFLIEAEKYHGDVDLGCVGEVKNVNPRLIELLWEGGFLPVVSPVSVNAHGESLNVNADWVAAKLAQALSVDKFIFFSDVPGVLRDPEDRSSLIETLTLREMDILFAEGRIRGGMIPKLAMLKEVLQGGVKEVFIGEGEEMRNLVIFLSGGSMRGTRIVP
ncbi:MAG: acetylglutamate kinase [Atribacterota bacterium]|nr:acetylglutamate kinase [Atribacterota bacterium]